MCLLWLTSMILLWLLVCIFGKAHLCEVSYFCTMFTLILLSWAIKLLCIWGITTSGTLVWIFIRRLMLVYLFVLLRLLQFSSFTGVWFFTAFFFIGGRLVQLCHKTLIWVVPLMLDVCCLVCLAVDLLDSSFLAICWTLAAGYCAWSMLPSLMVLAINSLSVIKNRNVPSEDCSCFFRVFT